MRAKSKLAREARQKTRRVWKNWRKRVKDHRKRSALEQMMMAEGQWLEDQTS